MSPWTQLSKSFSLTKIFRKILYDYIIRVLLFSPAKSTEDVRPNCCRSAGEGFVGVMENASFRNVCPITHCLHDNCQPNRAKEQKHMRNQGNGDGCSALSHYPWISTLSCPRFLKVLPTEDLSAPTFPTSPYSSSHCSQALPHLPTHSME